MSILTCSVLLSFRSLVKTIEKYEVRETVMEFHSTLLARPEEMQRHYCPQLPQTSLWMISVMSYTHRN